MSGHARPAFTKRDSRNYGRSLFKVAAAGNTRAWSLQKVPRQARRGGAGYNVWLLAANHNNYRQTSTVESAFVTTASSSSSGKWGDGDEQLLWQFGHHKRYRTTVVNGTLGCHYCICPWLSVLDKSVISLITLTHNGRHVTDMLFVPMRLIISDWRSTRIFNCSCGRRLFEWFIGSQVYSRWFTEESDMVRWKYSR